MHIIIFTRALGRRARAYAQGKGWRKYRKGEEDAQRKPERESKKRKKDGGKGRKEDGVKGNIRSLIYSVI